MAWVGTKALTAAAEAAVSAAVSKAVGIPVDAALAVEVRGATLAAWGERGEMILVGLFTAGKVVPQPSFEQKVERKLVDIQAQLDALRGQVEDLEKKVQGYQWYTDWKFFKASEKELWQYMATLDSKLDSFYRQLDEAKKTSDPTKERRRVAKSIVSTLDAEIEITRKKILGQNLGERLEGFLETWQQQSLREADFGWDAGRLVKIYELMESKFRNVMLIQLKCARLLMAAHDIMREQDSLKKSGIDYFVGYYPILKGEVEAFRDMVETLAINLLPLPTGQMLPLKIHDDIAGMLARLDVFTAQSLLGTAADGKAPGGPGPQLPGVPALAGCWGRVLVPSTRWLKRPPGSKEKASVTLTAQDGRKVKCEGTLEVRAVEYLTYKDHTGAMRHEGYQLQVGNEPRNMDKMLLAHFTPSDALPQDLSGTLDVRLEVPQDKDPLTSAQASVYPIPVGNDGKSNVPYATFMTAFTGGAGVRGR